uniref:Uncharacterized protein n=1 Tax=Lepeophtheirus salmonis TaxID=72036 RepID=A0A0K2T5T7_LEPSM
MAISKELRGIITTVSRAKDIFTSNMVFGVVDNTGKVCPPFLWRGRSGSILMLTSNFLVRKCYLGPDKRSGTTCYHSRRSSMSSAC